MAGDDRAVHVDGRQLRLTHLDKVLYPHAGFTKAEVVDYYARIAPLLLGQLAGRPITRKRWPHGVGTAQQPGPSFFAKDVDASAPEWVARRSIAHSTGPKRYVVAADTATVVWLAQTASLELHTPQWRFEPDGARGDADRLVLDLDPGEGAGLPQCAQVARWARELLQGMGLQPVPVTSGGKGIHLYAPLPPGQRSEAAWALAHELARALEADHPEQVVSSMARQRRAGRVLIDWSQNNAAKTTVTPSSLRGGFTPTVAAPRSWDELDDPQLRQLTPGEVLERAAAQGDLLTP